MPITRRHFMTGACAGVLISRGGLTLAATGSRPAATLDFEGAWICAAADAPRFRKVSNVSAADPRAALVTRHITDLVGLVPNFEMMEGDFKTGWTAFAVIRHEKRYIVFDRAKFDWSSGHPSWRDIGVLAHEIGHHLNGHTVDSEGARWQTEAEADWFAGYVIARLNGTLQDALQAFSYFSISGSKTHPPRSIRLKAVEAGWRHAQSQRTVKSSN